MTNADLLRRLRFALQLDDRATQRLLAMGGRDCSVEQIQSWRLKQVEDSHASCDTPTLSAFLAGLVLERRGPAPGNASGIAPENPSNPSLSNPAQPVNPWHRGKKTAAMPVDEPCTRPARDNNEVLKRLRIALSLRGEQVHEILQLGGCRLSASEVGALLRSPQARNYRRCGDQVLRQFLTGLGKRRLQA